MRLLVLLCVFLHLFGVIQASPTTDTTTSDNFEAPTFTTRTIWSIISSSVLTLFACIYSAIHPNIPSPKDSPLRILWRRLGIMIMALITPELIVTWAMRQWFSARHVTRHFKESGYFKVSQPQEQSENHGSITATAEQYVEDHDSTRLLVAHPEAPTPRYGGTRALAKPFKKLCKVYVSEQSEDYTWTQTHSFFVLMGGFMLYVDKTPYHTLQPDEVLKLISAGCIDAPTITAKRIHDKSKGNAISKGLVMLQVTWFIMQLITRAIYHLKTTQLEVGTLAFAVLNFLTFAAWWNKPLDVQCPYPVYWKSAESRLEDHINIPEIDALTWFQNLFTTVLIAELAGASDLLPSQLRVPTFDGSIKLKGSDTAVLWITAFLMASMFGGIHCMAWFFAFTTYQEQVLWRMSAVAITCTPWLIILTACLAKVRCISETLFMLLWMLCVVLYGAARAILLVLMFTTLRNLPPDAYKAVSWTSLVPHL